MQLSLRQFFTKNAFRKEIALVIILKLILLALLWSFFFSHPTDQQLTRTDLMQHYH